MYIMKIAILESIVMPAGHEVEFDRILVNELKRQGHTPVFFVPEKFPFKVDYQAEINYLDGGEVVTYAGAGRLKRLWLSMLREKRRIAWFNSAYEKAVNGECDAIIIPTATFRYIRTLRNSKLLHSSTPVYMIFHGINPKEQPRFEKQARAVLENKNIHLKVITLRDDFANSGLSNVDLITPPVFTPTQISYDQNIVLHNPLRLGFFGQYRKEKNIEFFIDAFLRARFAIPVTLTVQGATAKPEDSEAFEKIMEKYKGYQNIVFLHKNLIGSEWEKALLEQDAIMMPYAAERYRYHWGAMLFTALGFWKPALVSPELNPEVLEHYKVGKAVTMHTVEELAGQLESFVQDISEHKESYLRGFKMANNDFSHEKLIHSILK